MSVKNGVTGYVQPNDAGLASEPSAVGRRIAKVLDALSTVNRWVVGGEIEQECHDFSIAMLDKLKADGWDVRMGTSGKYLVKPGKGYWNSLRCKD